MITVDAGLRRGGMPQDYFALAASGVRTILSLQTGWWEFLRGKLFDGDEGARAAGIEMIHLKLSNFGAPKREQVLKALWYIKSCRPRGIYVHCKHGVDRTGFVIAAYRVLERGWDVEDAIDEWFAEGFHWWWYWTWPWTFRRMMADIQETGQ